MAGRIPVRALARHLHPFRHNTLRQFSCSSQSFEAQNFMMPAMSPTMTEGNISSWKVKEGDSFSTGDVLLEIETDKASMDVEAQDDGIMAKIFAQDGAKAVQVGTRIAVIAEAGDDLSSLSIPEDTSSPSKSGADNVKKASKEQEDPEAAPKGTPENKRPDRDRPKTSSTGPGQNPKYPLYPAVQALALANHIPESDVLKIPATGPGNRLLKGDVLAYLGSIESEYSKTQSERIEKLGHLDLSNVKLAAPRAPSDTHKAATTGPAAGSDSVATQAAKLTSISINVSLTEVLKAQKRIQETLGTSIPLSAFLARAVDQANDDLPLAKGAKPSSNDLFNAVLGLDKITVASRGTYLPQITALPAVAAGPAIPRSPYTRPAAKPVDIIDILSGKAQPVRSVIGRAALAGANKSPTTNGISTGAMNVFSLTVPAGEEKRARTFLERVKTVLQIEPARLIL